MEFLSYKATHDRRAVTCNNHMPHVEKPCNKTCFSTCFPGNLFELFCEKETDTEHALLCSRYLSVVIYISIFNSQFMHSFAPVF